MHVYLRAWNRPVDRPEVALCGSGDVKIQLLTIYEVEIIMCMDTYTCLSLQVPTNVS